MSLNIASGSVRVVQGHIPNSREWIPDSENDPGEGRT